MAKQAKKKAKDVKLTRKVGGKAVNLQQASSRHIKKYLTRRVRRIVEVRRFVVNWLLLVSVISIATVLSFLQLRLDRQVEAPQAGGVYVEGIVGDINNLNPLFASGVVDDSITALLFNGILKYDETGTLVNDMAAQWKTDKTRTEYTVDLRKDLKWHDGQPVTAEDVVYTITTIQDTETRSTLHNNWLGVDVSADGSHRVIFKLPAPFTPFTNTLTTPILPSHLLKDIEPSQLRTATFSTNPVGTGPFIFAAVRDGLHGSRQIEVTKNDDYHRGSPKLDRFILRTYGSPDELTQALRGREITAAAALADSDLKEVASDRSIRHGSTPLNSGVFAFFKTTQSILKDASVRSAMVQSIDRQAIISLFDARYAVLKTPLLPTQLGYSDKYAQQTNVKAAESLLNKAGWRVSKNQVVRHKDKVEMGLSLVTVNNPEYIIMADELQKQWGQVGIKVDVQILEPEEFQRTALTSSAYDILLYGISMGYDPDVYAYWHSSQARPGGLNFSKWESSLADTTLDIGRTRLEPVLREARYRTFQKEWRKDAPAVALYQPRANYSYHQNAHGFVSFPSNSIAARLTNVESWTVNTHTVSVTP